MLRKIAAILAVAVSLSLAMSAPARGAEDEGTISMNFSNADIMVVIKYISEMTGKNFVVNDKVVGKVTILSPKKVTKGEAYKVFESILSVYGFTAVPSGSAIKIVPTTEARQLGGTLEGSGGLSGEMRDQMVTQLIPLKYISADNMVNALRPLIAPTSYIASYQQSNTIIVVDLASNLERIASIISKLDVEGKEAKIIVLQLKHAVAKDIAAKVNSVMGKDPAKPVAQSDQSFTILADERLNALIVLGNDLSLNKVKTMISQLDIESPPGRQEVNVVYLSNANAEDLSKVVNQIVAADQKKANPQTAQDAVFVTADKATNAVIVTASPEQFVYVRAIVQKLDIPRRQVFVEALIFEVRADHGKKFGIEWRSTQDYNNGGKQVIGGTDFGNISNMAANPIAGAAGAGMVVGVVEGTIKVGDKSYANIGGLLQALQTDSNVNILSTPNILTTDNEEAKIFVGENVPFLKSTAQTTGGTPIVSVDRQDIGTTMKLTPQINENKFVRLKIFQETSSISPTQLAKAQDIITFKRTAETVVVVKDNQNIIIGGLISEDLQEIENKVPFFGDLPGIGWLFKSKSKSMVKTNLLIFLTPHIINTVEDMKNITDKKMKLMEQLEDDDQKEKKKEKEKKQPNGAKGGTTKMPEQEKQNEPQQQATPPPSDSTRGERPAGSETKGDGQPEMSPAETNGHSKVETVVFGNPVKQREVALFR